MKEKARCFDETVNYRRAVRIFHPTDYDPEALTRSLKRAILAPTSSNMQLYELYRISDPELLKKIAWTCLNQNTAKHAKEMVVVVTRPDLWKKRAAYNLQKVKDLAPTRKSLTGFSTLRYYSFLMPFLYFNDPFGLMGRIRQLVTLVLGISKPTFREVLKKDTRVVVHKSAALVAQTIMLSMAAEDHDTCPVEGFDSWRLKRILGLPFRAEINMVITCGKRVEEGIYGPRIRVPESELIIQR